MWIRIMDGVGIAVGFFQLLLELGEEGLVFLVQELRLLPQPLVLFHDVAVLQVQLRVDPFHCFLLGLLILYALLVALQHKL